MVALEPEMSEAAGSEVAKVGLWDRTSSDAIDWLPTVAVIPDAASRFSAM